MKKQYIIFGIIIMVLLSVLSGCFGPKSTEYFNEEYQVDENTVLNVATINGQIEINTYDGDKVIFNAIKKSSFGQEELDKIDIIVIEGENELDIEAKYLGQRLTTPSIDMNIKVPKNITVDTVTTSNGPIQISGVKGDVIAKSSNGEIIIEDVYGYVSATTSNGRIEVKETTGIKDLESSNLGINAEINDFKENISISTSNGVITVYINPSLNANIEMSTSNGHITISGLSLNLTTSEEKYKVGKLGEGGNTIDIQTSNGNIYLYKLEI
ncbi:hypothetical protein AYK20_06310 [Thermoplasmatales archaeon SG8-52-1]|nr:MAG: hypothetical protein AYK20_06310 [Thermoplasmatales archaeon SG8-52-1]